MTTERRARRRSGQRRQDDEAAAADPCQRARQICLRLLAVRPRTRAELATALQRRGISDEDAAAVLERYSEVGMIDDEAFARAWVSSRHHGRGLSRGKLARELRQRGVGIAEADEALRELDEDTESATARTLVDRRLRSMSALAPEVAFRRLVGMLARKGYPAGLSVRTVRAAMTDAPHAGEFAPDFDVDAITESVEGPSSQDGI